MNRRRSKPNHPFETRDVPTTAHRRSVRQSGARAPRHETVSDAVSAIPLPERHPLTIFGRTLVCSALVIAAAGQGNAQTFSLQPIAPLRSTESRAIVPTATLAPAAPTRLQAIANATHQIFVVWQDNADNESEFRIEGRGEGGAYQDLGSLPANTVGTFVGVSLSPGSRVFVRIRARNAVGDSVYTNEVSAVTLTEVACIQSADVICLNDDRFRVQALFLTAQGVGGVSHTVKLTDDSGYLWFFGVDNIEAVVKVIDGCAVNNAHWVFAGGLTDVRVMLIVTDTAASEYGAGWLNPLGRAFAPIQDTSTLKTCAQ